jgi:hypothetical protein
LKVSQNILPCQHRDEAGWHSSPTYLSSPAEPSRFGALRLPEEMIAAADIWAAQQPDKPSRSEALRRLIDLGIKASTLRGSSRKR